MNRFQKVIELLDRLVEGSNIGGHGAFWRGVTRDEFVQLQVFGFPLVSVGDPDSSNIIKALSAIAPFGVDVGTPGAFMSRMPSGGRPPAEKADITFIYNWIAEGCLEDDIPTVEAVAGAAALALSMEQHNAYWREFDSWAMFEASPKVQSAINQFFPIAALWFTAVGDPTKIGSWESAINEPQKIDAIRYLSQRMLETVHSYYGNPVDLTELLISYELFGSGGLPPDPLRPQDPDHNMNGSTMWFIWSAFADACLRLKIEELFWISEAKAILVGLMNDGLIRGRFTVSGFDATPDGSIELKNHVVGIADDASAVQIELAKRFLESGFTLN